MRVAALYDIHGNLSALEAVIAEVRALSVDEILVGGDVIPGPMPHECLDLLARLDLPVSYILGNGDRETIAARRGTISSVIPGYFREAMSWNAAQLTDDDERAIGRWPLIVRRRIDKVGEVLFCHATPRNDTEIFTAATAADKLLPIFEPLNVDLVVCGHVHMQFDRVVGRTRVVNAGSVGMPFDEPGAYWLLIGPAVELRRTPYDLQLAAERVRRTSYPQAQEFATKSILEPPSQAAMIEVFSKAELK